MSLSRERSRYLSTRGRPKGALTGETNDTNNLGMEFVPIRAGTFCARRGELADCLLRRAAGGQTLIKTSHPLACDRRSPG